jgi:hypothetical protein
MHPQHEIAQQRLVIHQLLTTMTPIRLTKEAGETKLA